MKNEEDKMLPRTSRLPHYAKFFRSLSCSNCLGRTDTVSTTSRSWKVLRVNHIAVASDDLQKSVKLYKDILGIKTSEPVQLLDHGVTTVFVELGNTKLELLQPLGESSPIKNFLKKSPSGGMHHICVEVDNIRNAMLDLKKAEIQMLSDEPKVGAHGKPVVFLHPKDCGGVLIELEEA